MKQLILNFQKDMEPTGGTMTSSSQVGSRNRANRFQSPESDKGQRMNAIYGRRCLEQLGKFSHVGSWARTFQALLIGMEGWSSSRCRLTWRLRGTKYGRMYCRLQVSTLPTEETGFGLLLTPTTIERAEEPEKMRARAEKNGYKYGTKYNSLMSQIVYGNFLPTPTGQDGKNSTLPTSQQERDSLPGHILREYQPGETSQLNPQFVCEMMGFPPDWTLLPFLNGEQNQSKPTVMP